MGNQYSYTDYPDGENCIYKTMCCVKSTAIIGFILGSMDVIHITQPTTLIQGLSLYPRFMAPAISIGLAMGVVTCTATMMRKKDDHWNYVISGVVSGFLLASHARRATWYFPCMVLFGALGALYKEARMEGHVFFPTNYVRMMGSYDTMDPKYDFTLTATPPKYTGFED